METVYVDLDAQQPGRAAAVRRLTAPRGPASPSDGESADPAKRTCSRCSSVRWRTRALGPGGAPRRRPGSCPLRCSNCARVPSAVSGPARGGPPRADFWRRDSPRRPSTPAWIAVALADSSSRTAARCRSRRSTAFRGHAPPARGAPRALRRVRRA
jgi:hypothetical protein